MNKPLKAYHFNNYFIVTDHKTSCQAVSTLKKDDDKEMMADIASVILLLAVSEERQQQTMEAREEDSVFRHITTCCFKKWPDKHSLIKKGCHKNLLAVQVELSITQNLEDSRGSSFPPPCD